MKENQKITLEDLIKTDDLIRQFANPEEGYTATVTPTTNGAQIEVVPQTIPNSGERFSIKISENEAMQNSLS